MDRRCEETVQALRGMGREENLRGMARYGINTASAFGVPMPRIREFAKRLGKDHGLALQLWRTGFHEAMILAALIADPRRLERSTAEEWASNLDSWDVCDQLCSCLLDRTPYATELIESWTRRDDEYVKRAGFVIMAALAVHDKRAPDSLFLGFLPRIVEGAADEKNFVRKAVNWALRQIGKRNLALNREAVRTAHEVAKLGGRSASWVAKDALRELTDERTLQRLKTKGRGRT